MTCWMLLYPDTNLLAFIQETDHWRSLGFTVVWVHNGKEYELL